MLFRFRISRKEAKESAFWIRLLYVEQDPQLDRERLRLYDEAVEIIKILSTMIKK